MVLIDVPQGNSLMYLPLDQIIRNQGASGSPPRTSMLDASDTNQDSSPSRPSPMRDVSRERSTR
jgi:hypothetical protein